MIDINAEIAKHVMKYGAAGLLAVLHKAAKAKAEQPHGGGMSEQMNAIHYHGVAEAIERAIAEINDKDNDLAADFRAFAD